MLVVDESKEVTYGKLPTLCKRRDLEVTDCKAGQVWGHKAGRLFQEVTGYLVKFESRLRIRTTL